MFWTPQPFSRYARRSGIIQYYMHLFCVAEQPNSSLGRLIVEVSRSHTQGKTPLHGWSASRRGRYSQNTKQTKEINTLVLSWVWTRDPRPLP